MSHNPSSRMVLPPCSAVLVIWSECWIVNPNYPFWSWSILWVWMTILQRSLPAKAHISLSLVPLSGCLTLKEVKTKMQKLGTFPQHSNSQVWEVTIGNRCRVLGSFQVVLKYLQKNLLHPSSGLAVVTPPPPASLGPGWVLEQKLKSKSQAGEL